MKCVLLMMVAFLVSLPGRSDDISKTEDIDYYEEFYSLERVEALKKGETAAVRDFKNGNYKVLVYGLRMSDTASEKYLQKTYGVEMRAIAGCIVSDGILSGAEGYNLKMKALLKEKYKKDIFFEAGQIKE